jgi:hypothetical protein
MMLFRHEHIRESRHGRCCMNVDCRVDGPCTRRVPNIAASGRSWRVPPRGGTGARCRRQLGAENRQSNHDGASGGFRAQVNCSVLNLLKFICPARETA